MNIINQIADIIQQAEKFRSVYFWKSPGTAGGRRSFEKYHSRPRVEWEEGGHSYSAEFIVICTCSHIEARGEYYKDGKKTTLTAIRNSYKRMVTE